MSHLLNDFPPGPLDHYRKKASFDWKKMKIFIESEDMVKFENYLCNIFRNHPEYQTDNSEQKLDDQRRTTIRRTLAYKDLNVFSVASTLEDPRRMPVSIRVMMQLCPSSTGKISINVLLFGSLLRMQGTERHYEMMEMSDRGQINGCFCMTEVGHGSNTKGIRTTATYDKDTQQFRMNTPDFEAAKCWAGGLGQTATYAAVFAQLIVDGVRHGIHTFLVPIRDPSTLLPYPGVLVGDLGEKIGLNGVDNGFLIFNNYSIPRENLLNKNSDVTPDGQYVTNFKSNRNQGNPTSGILSFSRIAVTLVSESYGTKALTIAIRYAAVRKQFGPDGEPEVPILEYQSHQHRLLPYLAATYVLRVFGKWFMLICSNYTKDLMMEEDKERLKSLGTEIHAVASAAKSVSGWLFRDAIQECREACGGHGYLKVAGIGDVRNDNDANCTHEGDNHVLIQQTSNWLLKMWPQIEKGAKFSTPLKSVNFLSNTAQILKHRFKANSIETAVRPEHVIDALQWLVCYLLKQTKEKFGNLISEQTEFWARNNIEVFYAKNLAIIYVQHFFLHKFLSTIDEATDNSIKNVLLKMFSLYGLWTLQKFLPTLYEGGYFQGSLPSRLIHEGILQLCSDIKDDAVSLIDAIAPPDFVLNSVLGASDGQVYKRLQSVFFGSPYFMSRPAWWQEIVNQQQNLPNKL